MGSDVHKQIKKLLKKDFKAYVLVTCKASSPDGFMQVEMSYDGDPVLAAYLMEGAQEKLDQENNAQSLELIQ